MTVSLYFAFPRHRRDDWQAIFAASNDAEGAAGFHLALFFLAAAADNTGVSAGAQRLPETDPESATEELDAELEDIVTPCFSR